MENKSRLTLIADDPKKPGYGIYQCECGTIRSIRKNCVTRSRQPVLSCGCLQREYAREHGRRVIAKNSRRLLEQNAKYNTNTQVISMTKPNRCNTSGVTGVSWDKARQKWFAYIHIHRKRIQLGYYEHFADAVKARKDAEDKYFAPILEEVKRDNGQ